MPLFPKNLALTQGTDDEEGFGLGDLAGGAADALGGGLGGLFGGGLLPSLLKRLAGENKQEEDEF